MPSGTMPGKRPDCFKCAHFYVTWDEFFPRGCKALSFKSREMPSEVVYASSGRECLRFDPKKFIAPKPGKR